MDDRESEQRDTVITTAREWHARNNLPKFDELLHVLRTGVVPAAESSHWKGKTEQKIIEHPVFPEIEHKWIESGGRPICDMREWKEFCSDIEGKDFGRLDADVNRIKEYLTKRGIVSDSKPVLKMDSHDTPLNFYQEGAEILPLDVFLQRSLHTANLYPEFARARWGEYTGKKRPEASDSERMASALVAPVYQYFKDIAPMQIVVASIGDPDQKQKRGAEPPLLNTRGARGVSVFVDPALNSDRWREKISEARTTPRAADAAQTVR